MHTGDDIAIIMSHRHRIGAASVHRFAWDSFVIAAEEASDAGLSAAGQVLLADAPSGNIRGAGPAVAEMEFYRDPASKDRPAEAFLVFAADKCGPGAYSYPLYAAFCDPNVVWDHTRLKVQAKADEWRRQGFIGPTMASQAELSYTGILETLASLEGDVELRHENGAGGSALDPVGHAPGRRATGF